MKTNTILLQIRKRSGLVYRGYVKSLSSKNDKGVFDILPEHANFITLIKEFIRFVPDGGEQQEIIIEKALLKVENNEIEVFIDITSFEDNATQ